MKYTKIVSLLVLLAFSTCSHYKEGTQKGRAYAERELMSALGGKIPEDSVSAQNFIIKDCHAAVNIAEPLLFNIYGKEKIESERPYEVYLIRHYWVITGSMSDWGLYEGGKLLIIIDACNGHIIK